MFNFTFLPNYPSLFQPQLYEGTKPYKCVLLAELLAFALLHFVLQGQICMLLQLSLDFLLLHSSPL